MREEVKRCIAFRCTHRDVCKHGLKQKQYDETFTEEEKNSDIVMQMFPPMYPVWCGCPRWKTNQEEADATI